MTDKAQPLSKRIYEVDFKKVKGFDGISPVQSYKVDQVDHFLTEIAEEVEDLERTTGKLYEHYERTKNAKNNATVETSGGSVAEIAPQPVSRASDSRIEKMQQHMAQLLEMAEANAEQVKFEAEMQAKEIIDSAKQKAKQIIEVSQSKAAKIEEQSEEKMRSIVDAKRQIESRSVEIKQEIEAKASAVEKMGNEFNQMSQNLRNIIEDKGEKNRTA